MRARALAPGTKLGEVEPLFPRIEKSLEELRTMSTGNESAPKPPSATAPAVAAPAAAAAAPSSAATPPVGPVLSDRPTLSDRPASDGHIAIDDFMKVELRVAKVLEAEAVPKSKKLIKLKVDAGTDQRTILAGIAEA